MSGETMTPHEAIRRFGQKFPDEREPLLYARLFMHFIGEHFLELTFAGGGLISHSDAIGVRELLEQLESAAAEQLGQVMQ